MDLTDEQLSYLEDAMRRNRIRRYVEQSTMRIRGKYYDVDEVYSEILELLTIKILPSYDKSKGSLDLFVRNSIDRKVKSYFTHENRQKRVPYLMTKNGVSLDKDGKQIRMKVVSFDSKLSSEEGDCTLADLIKDDFDVEKEVLGLLGEVQDRVNMYLNSISPLQRKIVTYLVDGYEAKDILEKLNITRNQYDNAMKHIRNYELVKVLF